MKKSIKPPTLTDLVAEAKRMGFDIREPGSVTQMENFLKDIRRAKRGN